MKHPIGSIIDDRRVPNEERITNKRKLQRHREGNQFEEIQFFEQIFDFHFLPALAMLGEKNLNQLRASLAVLSGINIF